MSIPFPGPIPAYTNPAIQPENYEPSQFTVSAITRGTTTTVTTSEDHNYVVGQIVRLLIPLPYGTYQLNNVEGTVLSIPSSTQVVVSINSQLADAFIATPYTATITNVTQASQAVVTANNSFRPGDYLTISDVEGMTQLNGSNRRIVSGTATSFTLSLNSSGFSAYTAEGTAELQVKPAFIAQIVAVGDYNSGQINTSGRTNQSTFIPGSYINISPQ